MPTDTKLDSLVINYLTQEQYDAISSPNENPIEYTGAKEAHHHTLTIKDGTKIIFATNRELESATAATNLETLISTFAGTTTAGFGDYILLTVDTAAKLKKQDGTEVDLSTLNVTIEDIL